MLQTNINDDLLTVPECYTDSTQCCTEENEVPAAEMIMIAYQIMQYDDKDRTGYWITNFFA